MPVELTAERIQEVLDLADEAGRLAEGFRPGPGEREVIPIPRVMAVRLCETLQLVGHILAQVGRKELEEQVKRNDPSLSLPGQEGALLRLLAVCDFDKAADWISSEVVRGTGPSDRFEVVSAVCANLITLGVFSVKDKHTRAAAQIVNRVGERVHQMVGSILAQSGSHVAPRLRIVTEGEP